MTSSSKLSHDQTSNPISSTNPTPKGRTRKSSKQKVENSNFEEHLPPIATRIDNRTLVEMLRAPTKGCVEAIVVPLILAEQFELKHSLINMMTSEQFFGLKKDNPHDHIRWFNKITSTIKYRDVPNSIIKLILFPFALTGAARRWLEKEPPRFITTWNDLVSKFINKFFPPHELRTSVMKSQIFTKNSINLLIRIGKDIKISSVHVLITVLLNCTNWICFKPSRPRFLECCCRWQYVGKSPQDALTIIENKSKQTSAVTTAMTAMLKQLQANPPPAQVKAVEEICVTCGGAHPYYQCLAADGNTFPEFKDNIQGYVSVAASNYNQGNPGYRPQGVANQMRPPVLLNLMCKTIKIDLVNLKALTIDMVKNELRNEMKTSIQTSLSNQTNKIKNMMASLLQMNTTSTSGSGSLSGNTVANPKGELKAITTRSGLVTNGPTVPTHPKFVTPKEDECVEETYTDPDLAEYTIKVPPPPIQKHKPSQEKNEIKIQKFWHMFKQLHLNITLAEALVLMPKYQKMLKALLSNKEKLQELTNTPLNEIVQRELNCKALADLGASINLMPLSVWKKFCLPDLIPTRMTLELVNRAICTPDGITRDVFVLVGKFTFPADFVIVDYESDPRVPLILGKPFLMTACALIDVHDCLEVSVLNPTSGNPTFSLHKEITSSEVTHEIHDAEGCNFLSEEFPDTDSFNDIHPYFDDNPLSGSTTYSSNSLLEEFTDELALITYPLDYDDNLKFDIESDLREIEFLLYQGKDSGLKDSIDQTDLANLDDYFVDPTPEMFTDEHVPDYSFPSRFDVYDDDFLEIESDADNFYDDPFDSKGEKIKESKLLIDELDLPCDFLPYSEYDSFNSQDFFGVDAFPSPDNEDKVFNLGILIQEKSVTIITRVSQEKKLTISYASLVFEDFDPPFYEPIVFKDVPNSMRLLPFSSKNEENVFKPEIYTSEKVKEKQENDKIGSKPDKNEKRGEAQKS
uniref:Retrotransposon gag domain-containing protein n=1 Tax=Tanacetum cinerariifolium TaxID=118510 RepID=A0A699GQ43_TANCI|nr:hypothetical protein [Tanacetum cinerariifolium]